MAMILARGPVTLTVNGIALERYLIEQLALPPDDISTARDIISSRLDGASFTFTLEFVRARAPVRKSCLRWRSVDWRNRQRGHPLHRTK